jgi:pimeloyl-ACP methyl ester carboxylesterase
MIEGERHHQGPTGCDLPCATCPSHAAPPPLSLPESLARFQREATLGTCDTGRYRMPYFTWGAGPPLVFVHGVSDCSRSFVPPIARLSAHFRCIAYDLPNGRGDGARLRRYRHADLVEDLWALLDHLKVSRAYLLGASFGSTVVLEAARARPDGVPRLILQAGVAQRRLRRAERVLAWLGRYLPGRMARVPLREKVLRLVNEPMFAGRPAEAWQYFVECTGRGQIAAFAHQARWLHGLDLRPMLPEVRQPVLLVCGDRDRVMPPRYEEVLLAGLPNAGRAVIEGCGHVPSHTHPEALAEVVRRFLTPMAACATEATCGEATCPGRPTEGPRP